MYIEYVYDRKDLGYECSLDVSCGIHLVSISDSAMLTINRNWNHQAGIKFLKKIPKNGKLVIRSGLVILCSNIKGKSKRIIVVIWLGVFLVFSAGEPAKAVGMPMPSSPRQEFISSTRGGEDEKLIKILAELEKPFSYSPFSDVPGLPSTDILGFSQAEAFPFLIAWFLPQQQRDIIKQRFSRLAATKNNNEIFIAYDGTQGVLTDKSTNHLTAKHGHDFGIKDLLPPNPNQKPTKYEQPRTRINNTNKQKFREEVKKILSSTTTTDVYKNVDIRGVKGNVYHCKKTNRVIGIYLEGEFAGQIMKAQPISNAQLKTLRDLKRLD